MEIIFTSIITLYFHVRFPSKQLLELLLLAGPSPPVNVIFLHYSVYQILSLHGLILLNKAQTFIQYLSLYKL